MFRIETTFTTSLLLLLLAAGPAHASPEEWAARALRHNEELARRELEVERAEVTRAVARGAYLPSVDLSFRYTRVWGADLDVGDFINPAYAALNQLLGQPAFPTDVSLTLPLRHETRLRLSQPLFRPEIYFGNRLADHGVRGAELTLAVYRRDLVATVKATYWAHARAALLDELLGRTRPLIEENLRVSELLVAQGKSTDEVVLRARADLAELDQRRREAARARGDAARYLAFLAGASLDDPPPVPPAAVQAAPALPPLAELESRALSRREELRLAELSADVARTEASLARSAYLPTLGVALDYGFQGNDIDFSSDRDSFAASVVLEWNLFRGLRDRNRAKVGEIAHAQALSRRAEVERQIRLDVRRAWHEAATAEQAITSSAARVESVRAAYEIVARRYAAGTAPQIELLQATTELTRAETDQILAFTEYQTRLALLERAAAIAELHQEKRP